MGESFPAGGEAGIASHENFAAPVLGVAFGIFDEVKHLGILGRPVGVGGKEAAIGKDKVVGGDGDSVGPFAFGLEVEGPSGEVFAGFPLGSCSGEGDAVCGGVFDAEAFEEGADDVGLENAGDEVGVEAFRLVGIADDEDFLLVGAFDIAAGIAGD